MYIMAQNHFICLLLLMSNINKQIAQYNSVEIVLFVCLVVIE